jgi:hypothetical protein
VTADITSRNVATFGIGPQIPTAIAFEHFYAVMPMHAYVFTPNCELPPAFLARLAAKCEQLQALNMANADGRHHQDAQCGTS